MLSLSIFSLYINSCSNYIYFSRGNHQVLQRSCTSYYSNPKLKALSDFVFFDPSLVQEFLRTAFHWLQHVDRNDLMYQLFHRYILIGSGSVKDAATQLNKYPTLSSYVDTIYNTLGDKGLMLLTGYNEDSANRIGSKNVNLVHFTGRSARRRGFQLIEPGTIPRYLMTILLDSLPPGVHHCVISIDAMQIRPSCQYDQYEKTLRGLVKTPSLKDLYDLFRRDTLELRDKLFLCTTADNFATVAIQALVTIPAVEDIPPFPIFYQLTRPWRKTEEAINMMTYLKKVTDMCVRCWDCITRETKTQCEVPEGTAADGPCSKCLEDNVTCTRLNVVAVCTDSEDVQAKAADVINSDPHDYAFAMFPDPIHVIKSFKNTLDN